MIDVDISRVWNCFSLPELLGLEKEVFDAHMTLAEKGFGSGQYERPELERIAAQAAKIRKDSDICLVLGSDAAVLAAQAAIELLQGPNHNVGKGKGDPRILFAGRSLSTRHIHELLRLTEGKDMSLVAVSETGEEPEMGLAFRAMREVLEGHCGIDGADRRITVVTGEKSCLASMAAQRNWACFTGEAGGAVSAGALLIMAAAGLDIPELLRGRAEAVENYDLRSFENPLWLYAAVREVMYRTGRSSEVLAFFEPGLMAFGRWWQRIFSQELRLGKGILPVMAEYPGDLYGPGRLLWGGDQAFETVIRFAPPDAAYALRGENGDPDALNYLAGKTLDYVNETAMTAALSAQEDGGTGILTLDCGALTPRKTGELFTFMEMAAALCDTFRSPENRPENGESSYENYLFTALERPSPEEKTTELPEEKTDGNS